ncbi:amino acid adenylation domain-containing protein [Streptomyces sp. NPDC012693]|uniref:amino acid adenylation domain-containing protein n=1 Tax=Streptomyces sp. NPDC012693 TaxID=3364844 RepID=UPI0036BB346F
MTTRLTAAQTEIWLAQQLDPKSAKYNLSEYLDIAGPLDPEVFARAVREAVAEVDSLGVRFTEAEDGTPRQEPSDPRWPFLRLDLSADPDPHAAATRWMRAETGRPLDLGGPLLAGALIKLSDRRSLWYQRYHHIAIDGYGMSLVARRVAEIYTARLAGRPPGEPEFGAIGDVLGDDEEYRGSGRYEADSAYWRKVLADWEGPSLLTAAPASAASGALREMERLPPERVAAVERTCRALRTSTARLLAAAVAIYCHHAAPGPEAALGFVVGGRDHGQNAPVTMANIVPLRVPITAGDSLAQVVAQVARGVRDAKPHLRHRCEDIRRSCMPGTEVTSFGPLVNIYPFEYGFTFAGHRATATNLSTGPVEDLSFSFHERGDGNGIAVVVEANPRSYSARQARDHLNRLLLVLEQLTHLPPDTPVDRVGIVTDAERRTLLTEFGRGADPGPLPDRRVHELFEDRVRADPHAPAVRCGSTVLTYAQVDERADRVAALLTGRGVTPGSTVVVALDRDHHLVPALLAVWKAGAVQVPVDVAQPPERIARLCEEIRPAFVLTTSAGLRRFGAVPAERRLALDTTEAQRETEGLPAHGPRPAGDAGDLAYVLFTSGSTGRPKGVEVEHRSVHAYLRQALALYPGLATSTVVHSPITFDLTVTGVYGPLVAGGCLTLVPGLDAPHDTQPEFVKATPAHLPLLESLPVDRSPRASLVLGGEQLLWESLNGWRAGHPEAAVFNEYGPTEATVGCAVHRVAPGERPGTGPVPIGRPLPGARLYLLDPLLRLMPPGTPGELFIAGDGLARGYHDRPELTRERFLPDPHGPSGARMYRTGDLAVWRPDGILEYVGRIDSQVKVRGHRIEPGEIEAALTAHPAVGGAVAVAEPVGTSDHQLIGYVTAAGPGTELPPGPRLREWAAERLPAYMVPRVVMAVDEIPLTPSGKVDRARLPSPRDLLVPGRSAVPPTPRGELLCGLFADVLGVDGFGPEDDFFDWGGSSLTGAQLVSRVRAVLGGGFSLADLLRLRTPAALAGHLTDAEPLPPLTVTEDGGPAPLSYAQQSLWYLAQLHGDTRAYHIRSAHRLRGPVDAAALRAALADVMERHRILRTVIRTERGLPHQLVLPTGGHRILETARTTPERLPADLDALTGRSFDLAAEPPFRAALLTLAEDDHVLSLTLHHGVADGWSLAPLHRDVGQAYAARAAGRAPAWEPLPVQYADYARWQRTALAGSAAVAAQEAHWTRVLAGAPDGGGPRPDRARPRVATRRAGTVPFRLSAEAHDRLARRARAFGATLFMAVHSALLVTLRSMGAPEDLVVGTPVAGRPDERLAGLVGCFLNTVPLRTDTSGSPSVGGLLTRVRDADLAALAAQDVPFDRIVELVRPPRTLDRHPVFQVLLGFNNTPATPFVLAGTEVTPVPVASAAAKFDLTVDLTEHRAPDGGLAGLTGEVEYDRDLFDRATADELAARLAAACQHLASADPDHPAGLPAAAERAGRAL